MTQVAGLGIEVEELGMVALIGLALVPGTIWTAKAPNGVRMALRAALVGGLIVGAIALESKLDKGANEVADAL